MLSRALDSIQRRRSLAIYWRERLWKLEPDSASISLGQVLAPLSIPENLNLLIYLITRILFP